MSESKELLEATIKGLEEKLESVKSDLSMKVRELEDVNKPEMTDVMFDSIMELVEEGIGYFDFSDSDNYDIEYELDYDNRVDLHDVSLNDPSEFSDKIMSEIDRHYKIVEEEDKE